ncbi:MAG TPA: sulfatase [Tepidisphaeraceae bacterium]|nr:sulfatase [Tepidisphaeraceae bacterium]
MPTRLFLILFILLPSLSSRAAAPTTRPNLILILIDDLGWRDLHYAGSSFYETPNIDRLASQSVNFTNAYSACPVCAPTRASIMTGKYPVRVGITDIDHSSTGRLLSAPNIHNLPLSEITLAKALKPAGYATWHVGKWHLGSADFWPEHQGFDVNIAGTGTGMAPSHFSPYKNPKLPDGPAGEYLADRLTSEAISLIEHRDPTKPFFLNLWHFAVHIPLQAPEPLIQKYTKKAHDLGLDKQNPLVEGEPFPIVNKLSRHITRRIIQSNPIYAAMIENLDTNVGRLLKSLDDAGIADNTLIIFTSDNGGLSTAEGSPTSNAPARDGKGWIYDGGTRIPFLLHWPGHTTPGSACSTPITSPDIYPTLLAAANLPLPPTTLDGLSLLPLLNTPPSPLPRDTLFWHYPHYGNQGGTPASSIRASAWKLIEFYEDHHLELYNLIDDPGESHNLAAKFPDVANTLHQKLLTWQSSLHVKFPTTNPSFPKNP